MTDPAARVHATAEVDADAHLEPGAEVWDRAIVRRGVRVGAGSVIGRDVLVDEDVVIGTGVKIHSGALLYRGVTIEDGVSLGPRVVLTTDRYPRTAAADASVSNYPREEGDHILLAHGSSIGAAAVIVGSSVGRFATVGAGAVVTHDVPPHALVAGNPAGRIGWVCTCGSRLHAANGEPAPAIVERYASDPFLACARCERRYVYVSEHDTLEERQGPATHAATPR